MTRQCSDCQLCCKLIPVTEIDKPGGKRCRHQRSGFGCNIYPKRPFSCRHWNCAWLTDAAAAKLRRPDRGGYVVDIMPDFVKLRNDETGEIQQIPVVQVWIDPLRPKEWERDPALFEYLDQRGRKGFAAIMRLTPTAAFVLFPPAMTGAGWQRSDSKPTGDEQHSFAEIVDALKGEGLEIKVEVEIE